MLSSKSALSMPLKIAFKAALSVPLKTAFKAMQNGSLTHRVQHPLFLTRINQRLHNFANTIPAIIDQVAAANWTTTRGWVSLDDSIPNVHWEKMALSNLAYLQQTNPEFLKDLIKTNSTFEPSPDVSGTQMDFGLTELHVARYYPFAYELPGWKKLTDEFSKMSIGTDLVVYPEDDENIFVGIGFFSQSTTPLKTLLREHQDRSEAAPTLEK